MSKQQDGKKKSDKSPALKTPKEKRAEKVSKKHLRDSNDKIIT